MVNYIITHQGALVFILSSAIVFWLLFLLALSVVLWIITHPSPLDQPNEDDGESYS